ncbi:sodium/potassium-transporting ATPase subunit alpha-like [Drosophila serrata]|uniref:sodium/potassium-transporting ATPase subunit alpha-like n=1 Tax=Drosophila serrata TaxID=7274 RepID=UPI000A1D029A|nr:sodium/potassium-transporting ATPase subunit alpha-like [Drosophila serrata]
MFGGFAILLWVGSGLCLIGYLIQTNTQRDPPDDNLYLGLALAVLVILTGLFTYFQFGAVTLIRTPIRELSETVRAHFRDNTLADERLHLPATISVVLGADMYSRVMQPGFLKIQDGLPVA